MLGFKDRAAVAVISRFDDYQTAHRIIKTTLNLLTSIQGTDTLSDEAIENMIHSTKGRVTGGINDHEAVLLKQVLRAVENHPNDPSSALEAAMGETLKELNLKELGKLNLETSKERIMTLLQGVSSAVRSQCEKDLTAHFDPQTKQEYALKVAPHIDTLKALSVHAQKAAEPELLVLSQPPRGNKYLDNSGKEQREFRQNMLLVYPNPESATNWTCQVMTGHNVNARSNYVEDAPIKACKIISKAGTMPKKDQGHACKVKVGSLFGNPKKDIMDACKDICEKGKPNREILDRFPTMDAAAKACDVIASEIREAKVEHAHQMK